MLRLANGLRSNSLNRTFQDTAEGLRAAHLSANRQKRTLYSLRHSYITWQLEANRVSPLMITKQCGTSVKMLEEHYAHLDIWQHREALTA